VPPFASTALRVLGALVLAAAAGCASTPPRSPGAVAEGRVSLAGRGIGDAEVFLVPAESLLGDESGPQVRAWTESDGTFRVVAPPGPYLLLARRGDQFAYFGRNPVNLTGRLDGLNLPLVPTHPVTRTTAPGDRESLSGRVLDAGTPVEGARVFVYLEAARGLRGPGYAVSEPTAPDGAYRLTLPPGTYFVAARQRSGGWRTGSLDPGDRFGVLSEFPVVIRAGEAVTADVETVHLPSREQMARYHGRFSRLSGWILDPAGEPVAGLRACLYERPEMLDRPAAVSEPTSADGRFSLDTPLSGTLFLGAREVLGGPPAPGERVGFYRGDLGAGVEVEPGGHLEGLRIVTQVVP